MKWYLNNQAFLLMSPCLQFSHLFYKSAHSVMIFSRLDCNISKGKVIIYGVLVFPSANMGSESLINRLLRLQPTIHSLQLPHKMPHAFLPKVLRRLTPLLFPSTNKHSNCCCPCLQSAPVLKETTNTDSGKYEAMKVRQRKIQKHFQEELALLDSAMTNILAYPQSKTFLIQQSTKAIT